MVVTCRDVMVAATGQGQTARDERGRSHVNMRLQESHQGANSCNLFSAIHYVLQRQWRECKCCIYWYM